MTRKEANLEILARVEKFVNVCDDQRFGQIIANYILPDYQNRDIFFEESEETLENLKSLMD